MNVRPRWRSPKIFVFGLLALPLAVCSSIYFGGGNSGNHSQGAASEVRFQEAGFVDLSRSADSENRLLDAAPVYRSPYDVAFSPDGATVAVSDYTAGVVALLDVASGTLSQQIALQGKPTGVVWSPDSGLVVSEYGNSSIARIDIDRGEVSNRWQVGLRPMGLAVAPQSELLLAANSATHSVSILHLSSGEERARVDVTREPTAIAVTPDESLAVVTNLLPSGRANRPDHGAVIDLINLASFENAGTVALPTGSTSVRDVVISPDGHWAYAVHLLGRINMPATQIERGWVNTNAMSVIDLQTKELYATVLFDHPMQGAPDLWGLAISKDGNHLYASVSGGHRVAHVDLETLHRYMAGNLPEDHRLANEESYGSGADNIWLRISHDASQREGLANDLSALHAADLIDEVQISGKGPRGIALSPDGRTLAAAVHFSGAVALIETETMQQVQTLSLGPMPEPDIIQQGRIIFHDATECFQQWMSCATCHPGEARIDGLNWDIPSDGIGNPKNNKSLLHAALTPPMTWRGVRNNLAESIPRGFLFMNRRPEQEKVEAVAAYLASLEPEPSPYLTAAGELQESAQRGEAIFRSSEARCTDCHSGELYTDLEMYDVGTRGSLDHASRFDVPSLIEIYRTAPYLHDGSAATLREVLERTPADSHGTTSHLSREQLDDLILFLKSL